MCFYPVLENIKFIELLAFVPPPDSLTDINTLLINKI